MNRESNGKILALIKKYFETNLRCKLPWTHIEISNATIKFKEIVDNI